MKQFIKTYRLLLPVTIMLPLCFFSISVSAQLCNDSVKISFSPSKICTGSAVAFAAIAPAGATNPHFQWVYNGAFVSYDISTYVINSLKTGDVVKCIFTGINCEGFPIISADSVIVSVSPASKPSISIATDASYICKGSSVTFFATAQNGGADPTYQWKINGTNAGSNSDTFSTSSLNNGDVVNCVLTPDPLSVCAVPSTASSYGISMTVSDVIAPSVSISASANDICPGTPVTFTASTQNAGTLLFYQWKLNGTGTGGDSAGYSNNNLVNGDEIYCLLTDSSGCSRTPASSETIVMIIKSLPEIVISPLDTFVAPGTQVMLNANVSGNISSYQWQPSEGLSSTTSLSVLTQPLLTSTNYFFNAVTNDGCSVSKETTIGILGDINMPNAFTPNRDGHNDVFRIPANSYINLREFSVYNRLGNKIFSTANISQGWDGTVNGKKQDAGVYVYEITGTGTKGRIVYKGSFLLIR